MDVLKRMQGGSSSDEEDDDSRDRKEKQSLEGLDEEQQMKALMGFGGFDTTKNKPVDDNQKTAARGHVAKHKRREYRQYMNRRSGYTRNNTSAARAASGR